MQTAAAAIDKPVTTKSTLLMLAVFLGIFGAHRFYTRKYASGFIQLITHGGFYLWLVIDIILIVSGRFTDRNDRPVTTWF